MLRLLLFYSLLLFGWSVFAQPKDSILIKLEQQLEQGNKRALRDIATFLNDPQYAIKAQKLLKNYTLLTPQEWNWQDPNQQSRFLQFYYEEQEKWQFSPLFDAFYITPLEYQQVKYVVRSGKSIAETELQLRFLVRDFRTALYNNDEKEVLNKLQQIATLQSIEANRFLLELFDDTPFQNAGDKYYSILLQQIVRLPFSENLQLILSHLEQKKLSQPKAIALLSQLTNVQIVENNSFELSRRYRHLLDSLGSMEQLRQYGYNQVFELRPSFFEFKVDYYGMVLSKAEAFPWIIKNAIQDVLKTEHPRALFYVAAQLFQFRNRPNWVYSIDEFQELLQRYTGLKVAIENTKKELRFNTDLANDPITLRNYVTYWAAHYEDYEWDILRNRFVNKNQAVAQTEVYENLFRRLNSSNDSVAVESYLALTKGDPIEVLALAKKYKDLLRNYNKKLPSFKYNYLEQLVQLTHFVQQNGHDYQISIPRLKQINLLKSNLPPIERYQLENEVIEQLTLAEITALEYEAILGVNIRPFTFSIGRILDRFYASNWVQIISNEEQLRLYLKKAHLFQNMGTIGICNAYFNKFDMPNDDLRQRLSDMYKVETDLDVLRGIKKLLADEDENGRLNNFFLDPLSVNKDDIKGLASLDISQYNTVVNAILNSETETAEKRILNYISNHLTIEFVPQLMQILIQDIQSEYVAKLLNKIYLLKKSPADWLLLWQTDGGNYKNWSLIFFDQQLEYLNTASQVSIKDINLITKSNHYSNDQKDLVLNSLQKIKSTSQIRRLKTDPKLNLTTDLFYFENFDFSYKELDDIAKLFEVDSTSLLLDFMERKSSNFTNEEKGSFYNSLFRSNWFSNYINDNKLSNEKSDNIKNILTTYLNESDLISEFEEQATIRNIMALSNRGKSLAERLVNATKLDAGEGSKAEIQEAIIARVAYEDIPVVLEYYDLLSSEYQYNFLNQDFGLPIFDLDNVQTQRKIRQNHQNKSPEEFYRFYLSAFGIDYLKENGQLDYQKIYNILQFDIVTPFVGGGGNKRDYFTFGIIKLLEFEFDTRLGYHPKLNENQRFYSYSSAKRANDWMEFLIKNNHAQPSKEIAPSFSKK